MENEFSVRIFFPDDSHMAESRWLNPEQAAQLACQVIRRPAAKAGIISRVIVTDGGDCTCFEWRFGEGITYPSRNEEGKFYYPENGK